MFLKNKEPIVILLGYRKRVGKDTSSIYLQKIFEADNKKVQLVSFASPMKQIIAEALGCDLQILDIMKNTEDRLYNEYIDISIRKVLQKFGNGFMKQYFGKDVWAKTALTTIKDVDVVIISDFRFKQEYKTIKNKYKNVFTINIQRDTKSVDTDMSEQELNDFKFDFVINNNKDLTYLYTSLGKIYRKINEQIR